MSVPRQEQLLEKAIEKLLNRAIKLTIDQPFERAFRMLLDHRWLNPDVPGNPRSLLSAVLIDSLREADWAVNLAYQETSIGHIQMEWGNAGIVKSSDIPAFDPGFWAPRNNQDIVIFGADTWRVPTGYTGQEIADALSGYAPSIVGARSVRVANSDGTYTWRFSQLPVMTGIGDVGDD